jgi:hypothetical protein
MGRSTRLLAPTLLALALSACGTGFFGGEQGSGNLVTESREVGTFQSIDVGSAIKLQVDVDASTGPSVTVTFDDNILDNVVTRVRGDTLTIDIEGQVNLTGDADRLVSVTTPTLGSLTASGATNVTVTGSTASFVLDVSGASRVDLSEFAVGDVDLDASGASSIVLEATGVVSGSASGASNVTVRGNPTSVLIDTSGAASVDVP